MDPYKVLGVTRNSSDDEIKTAYRKLAKQYHPDKYAGHDLEDLANEKIKKINEAYDIIQNERSQGGGYSAGSGASSGFSGYSSNSKYAEIRRMIQANNVTRADAMLDAITNHDAEWHYLKGIVFQRKGWYDGARQHFYTAYNLSPTNPEYQNAYNTVNAASSGYARQQYSNQSTGGCSVCNICGALLCADCCCDCTGGGGCC